MWTREDPRRLNVLVAGHPQAQTPPASPAASFLASLDIAPYHIDKMAKAYPAILRVSGGWSE